WLVATRFGEPGSEQVRRVRPSAARPLRASARRSGAPTGTRRGWRSPPTPTSRSSGTARGAACPPARTRPTRRRPPAASPTRPTWPTCASGAATPTATPSSKRRSPGCTAGAGP
ncbi:MAG: putative electron transport protein, partial [uncultured Blastococcus sp.]